MAIGKKTIDTLLATKNQTKTAALLRLTFAQIHGVMLRAVTRGMSKRSRYETYEHLCMDEKSVGRGQNYVSILYDGDTGKVIDAIEGRGAENAEKLCAVFVY